MSDNKETELTEGLAESLRRRIGVQIRVYPKRKWRVLESVEVGDGYCVARFTDGTDTQIYPGAILDYLSTDKMIDATEAIQ